MKKKYYPFVSICTPTFNRRPFIENIIRCYKNQTYPKNRMEWIVVDDGTDKVQDAFSKHKIPNFKYFAVEKMNLGGKRNFMHTKTKGSIIVYMDDDDYYPPDRVEHAVERLQENPDALCAGSSELYVYFKTLKKMVQFGPYGPNHSTAGTFAFRKTLLDDTKYDDDAALAEERRFLKDYTIPFVQLDPMKTILVFSHEHNTFDKRELLKQPESHVMKTSNKTVDMFIQKDFEAPIKKFFMEDIDGLLDKYEDGLPKNKPEVIKQTQEIREKREKMQEEITQKELNAHTGIIINVENGEKKNLTKQEVVNLLTDLQNKVSELSKLLKEQSPINTTNSEGKQVPLTSSQIVNLISSLQSQVSTLVKEKEELQKTTADTATVGNKELEKQISQLKQQLQDKESHNNQLLQDIEVLKDTSHYDDQISQLKQQLQDKESRNNQLLQDIEVLKDTSHYDDQISQLKQQLQEKEEQVSEYKSKLDNVTKEYMEQRQQYKQTIFDLNENIMTLKEQDILLSPEVNVRINGEH